MNPEAGGRAASLGDGEQHGSAEEVLEAAVPGGVPPVNPDAGDMGTSAHINPAAGERGEQPCPNPVCMHWMAGVGTAYPFQPCAPVQLWQGLGASPCVVVLLEVYRRSVVRLTMGQPGGVPIRLCMVAVEGCCPRSNVEDTWIALAVVRTFTSIVLHVR